MIGTERILPPGHRIPRPGRISIRVGEPLTFEGLQGARAQQRRVVTDEVIQAIQKLSWAGACLGVRVRAQGRAGRRAQRPQELAGPGPGLPLAPAQDSSSPVGGNPAARGAGRQLNGFSNSDPVSPPD